MTSHYDLAIEFSDGATKGKASRMFIDGDTIYSYGRHFPIAKRSTINGVDYLFNSDGYSSSTSKHKSYVLRTLTGTILFLPNCDLNNIEKQYSRNVDRMVECRHKLLKARAEHIIRNYNEEIATLEEQNKIIETILVIKRVTA